MTGTFDGAACEFLVFEATDVLPSKNERTIIKNEKKVINNPALPVSKCPDIISRNLMSTTP